MDIFAFLRSMPNAVGQGLVWGIMAIGVYITYRIMDIADMTVDGSLTTGGAVAAVAISMGVDPWIALVLAVIAGMIAGCVTGFFHTTCGIPAILSGILTQLALYSVNLRIMGISKGEETASTVALNTFGSNNIELLISSRNIREMGLENPLILLIIIVAIIIALLYWFFGTEMGCSLRATGANQAMARAQGINTNVRKVIALMISNGMVALSGALIAQYQGGATIDMGRGAIVIGLAAIIVGEVLFNKVFTNFALKLLAAVIGAIIYYTVITLVLRLGLAPTDLKLLTALVVALFLAVPYLSGKMTNKHHTQKSQEGVKNA